MTMDNVQWTILVFFLRKMMKTVAEGDTVIVNYQLSIVHYLSSILLDKPEFYSLLERCFRGVMPKRFLYSAVK